MIMIEPIPELVNPEKVSFIRHQIVQCIKTKQNKQTKALQGGDFPFRPERPILEGRAGMRRAGEASSERSLRRTLRNPRANPKNKGNSRLFEMWGLVRSFASCD